METDKYSIGGTDNYIFYFQRCKLYERINSVYDCVKERLSHLQDGCGGGCRGDGWQVPWLLGGSPHGGLSGGTI